jgi:hypothetical protein
MLGLMMTLPVPMRGRKSDDTVGWATQEHRGERTKETKKNERDEKEHMKREANEYTTAKGSGRKGKGAQYPKEDRTWASVPTSPYLHASAEDHHCAVSRAGFSGRQLQYIAIAHLDE